MGRTVTNEQAEKTVDQWFNVNCSSKVLDEKFADSDFWTKNKMFYDSVKDKKFKSMTVKQVNWLVKIKEAVWKECE